eukprot:scaffold21350_cov95-Skeletonema_marinoi.AAC.1
MELRSDSAFFIADSSNAAVLLLMMANDFGGVLIKVVVADAAVVNAAVAWPRRLDREINAVRANVEEICRESDGMNEIIVRLFTWFHVALQSTPTDHIRAGANSQEEI